MGHGIFVSLAPTIKDRKNFPTKLMINGICIKILQKNSLADDNIVLIIVKTNFFTTV